MKNIIALFLAFVFVNLSLTAQNILFPIPLELKKLDSIKLEKQDRYIKAWNWGSICGNLDSSMFMDYEHNGDYPLTGNEFRIRRNLKRIAALGGGLNSGHTAKGLLNSQLIVFEPTINCDSTINFIPKSNDTTFAVFGFYNKNMVVGAIQDTGINADRFIVRKELMPSADSVVLLDNSWPQEHFWLYDYNSINLVYDHNLEVKNSIDTTKRDTINYDSTNGRKWICDINLRALDTIKPNNLKDIVLKIKLEYKTNKGNTGLIKFDATPSADVFKINRIVRLLKQVGLTREDSIPGANERNRFAISSEMLRIDSLGLPGNDINLRARFTCDGFTDPLGRFTNNPYMKPEDYKSQKLQNGIEFITNLNIRVEYYGKLSIAIDYIKINTPNGEALADGKFDNAIKRSANQLIDSIRNYGNGMRLFRFYGLDEPLVSLWYGMARFNKLLHGYATTEGDMYYPKHYELAMNLKENWRGGTIGLSNTVAAPYIRKTNLWAGCNSPFSNLSTYENMKLQNGYTGFWTNETNHIDTLNDNYETFFINSYLHSPWRCDTLYPYAGWSYQHIDWNSITDDKIDNSYYHTDESNIYNYYEANSVQTHIEYQLRKSYFKENYFLFSDRPWWANIWHTSDWLLIDNDNILDSLHLLYQRPKTGEEFNYLNNLNVILGAKGYFCWIGKSSEQFHDINEQSKIGLASFSTNRDSIISLPSGENLVFSNRIGGDYIQYPDPSKITNEFQSFRNNISYNAMEIDSNSIYLGRKSKRIELYKMNRWLEAVSDTLMNLQLEGWYSKGFKPHYIESWKANHKKLSDFINLSEIKTRKLSSETHEQSLNLDSGLYDITLLKSVNDPNMEKGLYIGIANRRTSCLFYSPDTLDNAKPYDSIDTKMRFYTTAEFDTLNQRGGFTKTGKYHDSTWWQNKWWKRQGCREIELPIKIEGNTNMSIRVNEIGADNLVLNSNFWRKKSVYNMIDTMVRNNESIKVKLMPGEAKILYLKLIPQKEDIKGYLDYSNQHKLIVYPSKIDSNGNIEKVRYHMVYYDENPENPELMNIYYKRSFEMNNKIPDFIINWEPEKILISHFVETINSSDSSINKEEGYSFTHPSIVVRDDTNNISKAYIVYEAIKRDEPIKSYIVESILEANSDNPGAGLTNGRVLGKLNNTYLASENIFLLEYGAPDINASALGNYYCWADPDSGIFIGWKNANSRNFTSGNFYKYIRWYDRFNSSHFAKHPSFNNYSRININEDDCAIVWQEDIGQNTKRNNIFYTRLRIKDQNLNNFLPNRIYHTELGEVPFSASKMIAFMSNYGYDGECDNTFPFLHRGVEENIKDSVNILLSHWDRVYWQSKQANDTSIIVHRALDMGDSLKSSGIEPDGWNPIFPSRIFHRTDHLISPNASQGVIRWGHTWFDGITYRTNATDSIIVLNFVSYPKTGNDDVPEYSNSKVWNLFHGYWKIFNGRWENTELEVNQNAIYSKIVSNNGLQAHLATIPFVNNENNWNFNRRIFNSNNPFENSIVSSLQYFYKSNEGHEGRIPFFGYADSIGNRTMISGITFYTKNSSNNINVLQNWNERSDSLVSNWFYIDNGELKYLANEYNSNILDIYIQRKSDQKIFKINVPSYKKMKVLKNRLINGNNQQFRLIIKKKTKKSFFTEDLLIGDIDDVIDEFNNYSLNKSTLDSYMDITDLGDEELIEKVVVYPNPADKYIDVKLSNKLYKECNVILYNQLGEIITNYVIKDQNIFTILLDNINSGVYYIELNLIDENDLSIKKFEKIIIQK